MVELLQNRESFSKRLMVKEDVLGTISPEQRVADGLVVPLAGMGDAKALGNEARLETIPRVIRDHS